MIHNEEVADFRKLDFMADKDYLKKRQAFMSASATESTKAFLNYCNAIIKQHSSGMLSIREASYAIAYCSTYKPELNLTINTVVKEAICLKRHPSNYKEDHQQGWKMLVKQISGLNNNIA
jgi:hypothetical protein